MPKVLTVRLDAKTRRRLDKLASATLRSKSVLIAEAIRAYLDFNDWQIPETKSALNEADTGKFASDQEVKETSASLRRRAR